MKKIKKIKRKLLQTRFSKQKKKKNGEKNKLKTLHIASLIVF